MKCFEMNITKIKYSVIPEQTRQGVFFQVLKIWFHFSVFTCLFYKILGCRDPRYKHENQMNSIWSLEFHEKSVKCDKMSGKVIKNHKK